MQQYSVEKLAVFRAYMPQSVELNYQFSCLEVVEMGRLGLRQYLTKQDEFIIKKCMQQKLNSDLSHRACCMRLVRASHIHIDGH